MKARITWQILSVMACAALLAAPALAGDDEPVGEDHSFACTLDGAWWSLMETNFLFMSVYDSENHWWGTTELTFIGGDPGAFAPPGVVAVAFSEAKGQWHRTGRRTFEFTIVFYGLDAAGLPVYVIKNSGIKELRPGCGIADITSVSEVYWDPDANPFTDPPTFCVAHGSSVMTRMSVDPPCE
jgi:hypothetical protein